MKLNQFNNQLFYDSVLLIILKLSFSSFLLIMFLFVLGEDMFIYPDFTNIYSNCKQLSSNILYSKFICFLSDLFGSSMTPRSILLIAMAAIINLYIIVMFNNIFRNYLSRKGQFILICILALHPYTAIYFFRFYTELFACVGILLISIYSVKEKKIDFLFTIFALILMQFRNALIPVFFIFSAYEIIKNIINKKNTNLFSYLLLLICGVSYYAVSGFGEEFIGLTSAFNSNIVLNIIYSLGFRESVAGAGITYLTNFGALGYVQFFVSIILIIMHSLGCLGIYNFCKDNNYSILICFSYLLAPILIISHLRYLLPLIPILIFGISYLFFKNDEKI